MRLIRSFFFGGLAMFAAAIFLSFPASALDRDAGLYSVPAAAYVYVLPDAPVDAALAAERRHEIRSRDAHAVTYAVANQPLTAWRFNAETYSRIDPHIRLG